MDPHRSIYLADLTHTCQSVASNVFPLGVGLLASHIQDRFGERYDLELFKYPADLDRALRSAVPQVIGFSNYSWNCNIANEYARRLKRDFPNTVIVFGGPNYELSPADIRTFWSRYPWIDFYVIKEGERALGELLRSLEEFHFDVQGLKRTGRPLPNCHYWVDGNLVEGPVLTRVENLSELGSPYLKGLMDKFFDNVLIPMIHTTRGCPFTCTFCTEGHSYYNRVAHQNDLKQFEEELAYIAKRVDRIQWLWLTDANFGMYAEDLDKARIIAKIQQEYSWPKRVWGATGKNRKERIIEVASILQGALTVFASLQTTDPKILKNINRSNISSDALNEIVLKSEKANSETVTELILGLPGDSVQSHVRSLKDVVDANLGNVRMYQMILLPQTEMYSPESRWRFGMKAKYRLQQRSFGRYPYFREQLIAVESEEICVANDTLSFEDYLKCRELDFTVEILHNTGMFTELMGLCSWAGVSWFDVLYGAYATVRSGPHKLTSLYDSFRKDTVRFLFDSLEDLESQTAGSLDELIRDENGTNEIVKGKALAVIEFLPDLHDLLYARVTSVLQAAGRWTQTLAEYLRELKGLSLMRKRDFWDTGRSYTTDLQFDYAVLERARFRMDPAGARCSEPFRGKVCHSDEQRGMIRSYVEQYGRAVEGIGRIMMRSPIRTLLRSVECVRPTSSSEALASAERY